MRVRIDSLRASVSSIVLRMPTRERLTLLLELGDDERAAVLAKPPRGGSNGRSRQRHFELKVLDYKNRFRSLARGRQQ
jgi:hypothetical protein